MNVVDTDLPGVKIIEPTTHGDHRGFFLETWHRARYAEAGLPETFVQDNHSRSAPRTLRGLHYQLKRPQGKLVRCIRGTIFDVAVDIRRNSPTLGKWVGVELTEDNKRQIWIPAGFAHGFCVPTVISEVEYKCTDYYAPDDEHGVIWNDSDLAIDWPVIDPLLSPKDAALTQLCCDRDDLPEY
jgi:dTDP-4-dehydrorhamnose 3,5-epimerase